MTRRRTKRCPIPQTTLATLCQYKPSYASPNLLPTPSRAQNARTPAHLHPKTLILTFAPLQVRDRASFHLRLRP